MSGGPKKQTTTQKDTSSGTSTGTQTGATTGTTAQQEAATRDVSLPDWLQPLIQGTVPVTGQALTDLASATGGYQLPPEALQALTQTAGGNFLYGGPGQQAFIDASVRAAQPGIYSAFGAAGRGGGGLENVAISRAAQDAYAGLYESERGRQQQAASLLPGITALPIQLQQQLLQSAGQIPGQFSSLFGQDVTGTTTGQTSGTSTGTQTGATTGQSSSVGTQPIYQTPWWQTALGAGAGLAGLAMPGLGGASALGNIGSGLFGQSAMSGLQSGGLLGLFR